LPRHDFTFTLVDANFSFYLKKVRVRSGGETEEKLTDRNHFWLQTASTKQTDKQTDERTEFQSKCWVQNASKKCNSCNHHSCTVKYFNVFMSHDFQSHDNCFWLISIDEENLLHCSLFQYILNANDFLKLLKKLSNVVT
jgi:hypothetical protein